MSLLDGLFEQPAAVADGLVFSIAAPITVAASIAPGSIHRFAPSETSMVVSLEVPPLAQAIGQRLGVKIVGGLNNGSRIVIELSDHAQSIESFIDSDPFWAVGISNLLGTYAEWLCDSDGVWRIVSGAVSPVDEGGTWKGIGASRILG